jgi:hypothetical protein
VGDAVGDAAADNSPSPPTHAEIAAWTAVARVVFNLDEFLTRE